MSAFRCQTLLSFLGVVSFPGGQGQYDSRSDEQDEYRPTGRLLDSSGSSVITAHRSETILAFSFSGA